MAFTLTRHGQANLSGGDKATFYQLFSGEIENAFETNNVMMQLHDKRVIQSGKSQGFALTGIVAAGYHTPGSDWDSTTMAQNEKIINIDQILFAATSHYELDELMNHYNLRQEASSKMGYALAKEADIRLQRVAILGARSAALVTGQNGGTELTNANYGDTASTLAAGFFEAAQTLDELDVPSEDRYAVLKPEQYYLLAQDTNIINKDWDGAGSYSKGKVLEIAGITILKSNNLPQDNYAGVTGENNTYSGDFRNTVGFIMHRDGLKTLQLKGLTMEESRRHQQFTDLISARYAMGHGFTRPDCFVELKTA